MSNNAVLPMLDAGIDVRARQPQPRLGVRAPDGAEPLRARRADRRGAVARERGTVDRRRRRGGRGSDAAGSSSPPAGSPSSATRGRRCRRASVDAAERRSGDRRAQLQRLHERPRGASISSPAAASRLEPAAGRGGVAERLPAAVGAGRRPSAPARVRRGRVVGQRGGLRAARLHRPARRRSRHRGDLPRGREGLVVRRVLRRRAPRPVRGQGADRAQARAHRALARRSCSRTPAPSPTRAGSTTSCSARPASLTATDIDDMLDHAQLLAQLPTEAWRPIDGVAVMASSGGVAGVAADAADTSGVALPALDDARAVGARARARRRQREPARHDRLRDARPASCMQELFTGYAAADGVDALVLCWWAGEGDEGWSRDAPRAVRRMRRRAASVPLIVTPVEGTAIGAWTREFRGRGLTFCRGLASTYRALHAVDEVAPRRPPTLQAGRARPMPASRPPWSRRDAGAIVPFGDRDGAARAGRACRSRRTSCSTTGHDDDTSAPATRRSPGREARRRAAPHRARRGPRRRAPTTTLLPPSASSARDRTRPRSARRRSSVQPIVGGHGEAFIGLQARSDLGAVVLFGRGGVLVELAPRVGGRRLPLVPGAAEAAGGRGRRRGHVRRAAGRASPGPPRRSSPRWKPSRSCGSTPARGSGRST